MPIWLASVIIFLVPVEKSLALEYIAKTQKDHMFSYEKPYHICNDPIKVAGCENQCSYMKIFYDEMKHVNGRDEIPVVKALPERVDLTGIEKREVSIYHAGGQMLTYEIGSVKDKDCKFSVVFVHGAAPQKGELGVNDDMFGGNFNRLKHLAADNNGLYYSPSINFDSTGEKGIKALLEHIQKKSCPNSKVVIACASAGSEVCWKLAQSDDAVKNLSGIMLVGGADTLDYDVTKSKAFQNRIPIMILHGEKDGYSSHEEIYSKLIKADANYPARFVLFSKGGHGTPIRMIDWKDSLNCIFSQSPGSDGTSHKKEVEDKSNKRAQ